MFFLFIVVSLLYVAVGVGISVEGFTKASRRNKPPKVINGWTERTLKARWKEKNEWPTITPTPNLTLDKFYSTLEEKKLSVSLEVDALKAQAYRRMFWSPIWPLLVVGDVYRGYQKAKAGERVYLLEQSTKALEKAMTDKPDLDKAYAKAQEALEKATVK